MAYTSPFNKDKTLSSVVSQLKNASKMHLAQAKIVDKHIEDMEKGSPAKKQKGGGTTKTCLPAAKLRGMSKEERQKLVNSKKSAGAKGKYKRLSLIHISEPTRPY